MEIMRTRRRWSSYKGPLMGGVLVSLAAILAAPLLSTSLAVGSAGLAGQRSSPTLSNLAHPSPSPVAFPADSELAEGRFLVASRELRDPNFAKTVVLLLDYSEMGAMGLVINRPTELVLAETLPELEGKGSREDTLYHGGPVAINQMLMLVRSADPPEGSKQVLGDIHLTGNRDLLEELIASGRGKETFRIYAGHAGWAPRQLDVEVARGGWLVVPGNADMVFDKAPSEVWPDLIERGSVKWARTLRRPRAAAACHDRFSRDGFGEGLRPRQPGAGACKAEAAQAQTL